MKFKIKSLIAYFIGNVNFAEQKITVQNLSIFFSVLIGVFNLRDKRKLNIHTKEVFINCISDFSSELNFIEQRFPDLINIFSETKSKIKEEVLCEILLRLKSVFSNTDNNIDDVISWSYQYLKKDLEKAAFKKIGQNKEKIKDSDLLFTTQFFTDKYMVEYLVNESLTFLKKEDLKKIVVIDPASGGGNFLNYSFQRLYELYKSYFPKWSNTKIVDKILNEAIIGYDLDSDLSKIASLSLFIKACGYAIPSMDTRIRVFGGTANDKLGFLNLNIESNSISAETFKDNLEKIDKQNKIKVFVTNPPFMGKRDMDIQLKKYLLENYPQSKGDLCVSFLQRIINMMNKKDVLGVVSQNNWMYLSSLKDFRKFFLDKQKLKLCVDLGSNAFEDINGEKTSVALCITTQSAITSIFHNLKFKSISENKEFLSSSTIPQDLTFELNQNQFLKNTRFEFNYQIEHRFDNIEGLQLYAKFANPMQGTSTGDNSKFVKFAWEVNGNPDWKLVSKGGGFSKWCGLNYYKVYWGKNAETIKANKGSALRNLDKITSTQLVYSDTGTLGLNVRVLKPNQVFIASGPGIQVLNGDVYAHLAFLNSRIATFLLKLINPKFTISAGYISKIPVAKNILDSKSISNNSKRCLELKEEYLNKKLPNFEFEHIDYSEIEDIDAFIQMTILDDIESDYKRLLLESKIEIEIRKQYGFNRNEATEVKSIVGESPFFIKNKYLELSFDKLDSLLSKSIDLNCLSTSRAINGYSVGSESIFEDLAYKLNVHPNIIFTFIKNNIHHLHNTKIKYYNDLLHKIILGELGVKKISIYTHDTMKLESLIAALKSKYYFLNRQKDLKDYVISIIRTHHKNSFFNKPLISITDGLLTVGQIL